MHPAPSLRLALGLGDQELEQRLRPALDADGELVVVAQCLAADQLVQAVEARQADVVLVAWSLHRLTDAVLAQLDRPGLPIVLLVPNPDDERWRARRGPVLQIDADAATVRQVVLAARRGGRIIGRPRPRSEPVVLKPDDRPVGTPDAPTARTIAIAGGAGSPGRTTVAINLATALGAAAPTVLVEADMCAPALAAYLDRDPSRNLCTLAHVVREHPLSWDRALEDELQPLCRQSPLGMALCGPPKPEMRSSIAPAFIERLVAELKRRYQYVVLDVGPELLGMDTAAANHRAALAAADQVVLVAGSDLVGLWRARTALDQLDRQLGIQARSVSLVLNRYDAGYHHAVVEVEWHLGAPVVGTVPTDHHALQRAISEQRPVVVETRGRASRALLGLAERIYAGKLRLPEEPTRHARGDNWWRRLTGRQAPLLARPPLATPQHFRVALPRERATRVW